MPDLLSLYYHLPYPLRVLAVSIQGYWLNRWRYNRQIDALVEAALERERWPAAQWLNWQEERLGRMLEYAARNVPYYRERWARRRRQGDRAGWDLLHNWPVLSKEELRAHPEAFLSEQVSARGLLRERTGGTTGTPLNLWASREALVEWYALAEARWRRWYGISQRDRWANVGVRPVAPYQAVRPPFWVWNAGMRQLYLSSLHLKPEFLPHYVQALKAYRIQYLYGYPSAYFWLAHYLNDQGETLPMQVVVASSENLFDFQRAAIEQAFACPVRETYGQSEKITAAGECEAGGLHLWPEVGYTEFQPVEAYEPWPDLTPPAGRAAQTEALYARLICTTLINPAMPLIRYDILDLVEQPAHPAPCACARTLPILGRVLGRYEDTVLTRDGRRVGHLVGYLSAGAPVKEIQIIQEALEAVTVKVVPAHDWSQADAKLMKNKLHSRIGDCRVTVELVPQIERARSGKLQAVISKISPRDKM